MSKSTKSKSTKSKSAKSAKSAKSKSTAAGKSPKTDSLIAGAITDLHARFGKSPVAGKVTKSARPATKTQADVRPRPMAGDTEMTIGTELCREWRGKTLVVTVTADGFRLNDVTYKSLSAAATALVGCNCNGLVFFGVKPRPAKAAAGKAAGGAA